MKLVNQINIKNIPWEEKPADVIGPVWRYSKNPVIDRNPNPSLSRVFNSALTPWEDGFIGIFRGESSTGIPYLFVGHSKDGFKIEVNEKPIHFVDEKGAPANANYAYDPRLVKIEDTYYIIWCDDFFGPALAIAKTNDFQKFVKLDHPFLPFNRNGVLFPRKVNNEYLLLSRPSDSGHTAFGDIFLSHSKDLEYWGHHEHVMERGYEWWNSIKIGAGCNPIETDEGWLLFIHGVTGTCSGFVYSMGAVILDLENPSIVKYRLDRFVLTPEMNYETTGFVPNVIFPTSALVDEKTGRIAIYYGSADTYTSLAFTTIDEIIPYIKKHAR